MKEGGNSVAFCLSSDTMHPEVIARHLGLQSCEASVKGSPTGERSPQTHPYHIACFPSPVPPSARMEKHIEAILSLIEPLLPKIDELRTSCRPVVFCSCLVKDEDGWELSPELLSRMSRVAVPFCFSLNEFGAARATET